MAYTTQADVESCTNIVFDTTAQAVKMIDMATSIIDNYLGIEWSWATPYTWWLELQDKTFEVFAKKCWKFVELPNPKINSIISIDWDAYTWVKWEDYVVIWNMLRFCWCNWISCWCKKCLWFTTVEASVWYDPLPPEISMTAINIVRALWEQILAPASSSWSSQWQIKRITQWDLTKEWFSNSEWNSWSVWARFLPWMESYLSVLEKYKTQQVEADWLGCLVC